MKVLFTDCWVGWYVGEGCYEGGTCPDILITNVPEDVDTDDLFDVYLYILCNGCSDHDKKEFKSEVVKTKKFSKPPVEITSKEDLEDCNESFITVDFDDLVDWYDDEEDM